MKKEYLPFSLLVTAKQNEAASKFIKKHDKTHVQPGEKWRYTGAIGGAWTWCFTPTTIGEARSIKCCCGEEFNLTDYKNW